MNHPQNTLHLTFAFGCQQRHPSPDWIVRKRDHVSPGRGDPTVIVNPFEIPMRTDDCVRKSCHLIWLNLELIPD